MRSFTARQLFGIFTLLSCAIVVLSNSFGDEPYQNFAGNFWAFSSEGVTVIDPTNGYVVKKVSLPTKTWGNTVFIRDQAQIRHYVFANDYDGDKVNVFDHQTAEVVTQVSLSKGAKPLHIYAVRYYDEVWTHNDGFGAYDVFRMAQVSSRESSGVQSNTIHVSAEFILIF